MKPYIQRIKDMALAAKGKHNLELAPDMVLELISEIEVSREMELAHASVAARQMEELADLRARLYMLAQGGETPVRHEPKGQSGTNQCGHSEITLANEGRQIECLLCGQIQKLAKPLFSL